MIAALSLLAVLLLAGCVASDAGGQGNPCAAETINPPRYCFQ